jgi:hypothetical protein
MYNLLLLVLFLLFVQTRKRKTIALEPTSPRKRSRGLVGRSQSSPRSSTTYSRNGLNPNSPAGGTLYTSEDEVLSILSTLSSLDPSGTNTTINTALFAPSVVQQRQSSTTTTTTKPTCTSNHDALASHATTKPDAPAPTPTLPSLPPLSLTNEYGLPSVSSSSALSNNYNSSHLPTAIGVRHRRKQAHPKRNVDTSTPIAKALAYRNASTLLSHVAYTFFYSPADRAFFYDHEFEHYLFALLALPPVCSHSVLCLWLSPSLLTTSCIAIPSAVCWSTECKITTMAMGCHTSHLGEASTVFASLCRTTTKPIVSFSNACRAHSKQRGRVDSAHVSAYTRVRIDQLRVAPVVCYSQKPAAMPGDDELYQIVLRVPQPLLAGMPVLGMQHHHDPLVYSLLEQPTDFAALSLSYTQYACEPKSSVPTTTGRTVEWYNCCGLRQWPI